VTEERARKLRVLQERHAAVVASRTSRDKARLQQSKAKVVPANGSIESWQTNDDDFDPLLQVCLFWCLGGQYLEASTIFLFVADKAVGFRGEQYRGVRAPIDSLSLGSESRRRRQSEIDVPLPATPQELHELVGVIPAADGSSTAAEPPLPPSTTGESAGSARQRDRKAKQRAPARYLTSVQSRQALCGLQDRSDLISTSRRELEAALNSAGLTLEEAAKQSGGSFGFVVPLSPRVHVLAPTHRATDRIVPNPLLLAPAACLFQEFGSQVRRFPE
jgi:hypothetical protein